MLGLALKGVTPGADSWPNGGLHSVQAIGVRLQMVKQNSPVTLQLSVTARNYM